MRFVPAFFFVKEPRLGQWIYMGTAVRTRFCQGPRLGAAKEQEEAVWLKSRMSEGMWLEMRLEKEGETFSRLGKMSGRQSMHSAMVHMVTDSGKRGSILFVICLLVF